MPTMELERVAVLKPDHLGDLILAGPAIRVLKERLIDFDLLINRNNFALARFLFGDDIRLKEISYSHLTKDISYQTTLPIIENYETIISLRQDHLINFNYLKSFAKRVFLPQLDPLLHETTIQHNLVKLIVGPYKIENHFYPHQNKPAPPGVIKRVGLCISAGHSSNQWALLSWLDLGNLLKKHDIEIYLIGGPQELTELNYLSHLLNLFPNQVVVGTTDYLQFGKNIANLDLIIASDSGTAHLCSLWKPILSLFGPSPHQRFSPFGLHNRVISLNLNCSPCLQFSKTHLNKCLSRECLHSISAQTVFDQLQKLKSE